jgi:hypothetical protein
MAAWDHTHCETLVEVADYLMTEAIMGFHREVNL